jgi:hypothetical protein
LSLPWKSGDGWGTGERVVLDNSTVADFSIASEESAKKFVRAAGLGVVGGLLLGAVGMVADALAGGNKKTVTFVLEFRDGRRLLATVDRKTYTKLQSALF